MSQLIGAARQALASLPSPDWNPASDAPEWTPDLGWHFRPGQFAYGGRVYPLSASMLNLLRLVVSARLRKLTSAELDERLWPDEPSDHGTDRWQRLRNLISRLNTELKRLFSGARLVPQMSGSKREAPIGGGVSPVIYEWPNEVVCRAVSVALTACVQVGSGHAVESLQERSTDR